MDELDRYYALLEETAVRLLDAGMDALRAAADSPEDFRELAGLRAHLLSDEDCQQGSALLPTGYFSEWPAEQRVAGFCAVCDLQGRMEDLSLERSCAPYAEDQPLFQQAPSLWQMVRRSGGRPADLIAAEGIEFAHGLLARLEGDFHVRTNPYLAPDVLEHLRGAVAADSEEWFVRLDPYGVQADRRIPLQEAIVRPGNPHWYQRLEVWPDKPVKARYVLQRDHNDGPEFVHKGAIRGTTLEVSIQRGAPDSDTGVCLLRGSIEELCETTRGDLLVGLMLHFTCEDPVGTEWKDAVADHLDGAVQFYLGETAAERARGTLCDGKVVDASLRTHLFRVDKTPLRNLFALIGLFFQSEDLLNDWLEDQFILST